MMACMQTQHTCTVYCKLTTCCPIGVGLQDQTANVETTEAQRLLRCSCCSRGLCMRMSASLCMLIINSNTMEQASCCPAGHTHVRGNYVCSGVGGGGEWCEADTCGAITSQTPVVFSSCITFSHTMHGMQHSYPDVQGFSLLDCR